MVGEAGPRGRRRRGRGAAARRRPDRHPHAGLDGLEGHPPIVALRPATVLVLTTFHSTLRLRRTAAGASGFLSRTPRRDGRSRCGRSRRQRHAVAEGDRRSSSSPTSTRPRPRARHRRCSGSANCPTGSARSSSCSAPATGNADLAKKLLVSEATVKTYVSRLLTKLDLANRTQAAILAHEAGLLES